MTEESTDNAERYFNIAELSRVVDTHVTRGGRLGQIRRIAKGIRNTQDGGSKLDSYHLRMSEKVNDHSNPQQKINLMNALSEIYRIMSRG